MNEKAHFITPIEDLMLTPYPGSDKEWILRTPIVYHSVVLDKTITVRQNFIHDLASTPRWLWWWYPPFGKWTWPAVLHDWEFWWQEDTFEQSNAVLREAMGVTNCSKIEMNSFQFGVGGIAGKWAWNDNKKITDKESGFVKEVPNSDIVVPRILLTHTI